MILEVVKELIKERKLRANDLSERIGVSPNTLSRNFKENGTEIKYSTLEALINVLGEREVYTRLLERLQTLEFVKMDIQDGVVWGVFLVNDVPSFVGMVSNKRIIVYVKELDTTIYNRKKLEAAVGTDVELEDIKEDTNIVNMWVYQYERKSPPTTVKGG